MTNITMYAVMKGRRMVEPAFHDEAFANEVRAQWDYMTRDKHVVCPVAVKLPSDVPEGAEVSE